ncbi:MAG: hypothetical protein K0B37_13445 [Bacteroidales bacterium]|nr:hypothetical protein [Bacteroidales bacterium]
MIIYRSFFPVLIVFQLMGSTVLYSSETTDYDQYPYEVPTRQNPLKWGVIPALAWDADLGLKYGGVFNLFDYGDYTLFPQYHQYLFVRVVNSTGGTLQAQAILESDKLLPQAKIMAEVSYIRDSRLDFYGFNGSNAPYIPELTDNNHPDFLNTHFYKKERMLTRLRLDVQRNLTGKNFRLLTGYAWNNIKLAPIREEIYSNSGTNRNSNLYEYYSQWGIIDPGERSGGSSHTFSLGLVYDTRNEFCYCTDGIWAETFLLFDPGLGSGRAFARHVATFRHHFSMADERLTFSYRISSQQKVSGNTPFYLLPWIYDTRLTNDGPGGAFGLRGAFRNRHVGEGFVLSNFEAKFRTLDFNLFNINFYTSVMIFYDNTILTQTYPWNLENVPVEYRSLLFKEQKQKLNHTFGPGLYIVFNKNNIISVNYGISPNPQNGSGGLYIGSSMLF